MKPSIIATRLKEQMAKRGMNAIELAKHSDVKPSFIYDILNGKSSNPSTVKLARVAECLDITISYLAGTVDSTGMDDQDYVMISSKLVEASAGGGTVTMHEEEGEPYYFRRSWIRDRLGAKAENLRLIHIRGDSMEPTLCQGDIVMVDLANTTPTPPGIFVLFDGMGLVAKRVEFLSQATPPTLRIISDNAQYSTYERAVDEVKVVGRVVWFAREI